MRHSSLKTYRGKFAHFKSNRVQLYTISHKFEMYKYSTFLSCSDKALDID